MTVVITQVELYIFVALLVAVLAALTSYGRSKKKVLAKKENIPEARKELVPQHRAIFLDLSPKSIDVIELAVEVWRINNRIIKAGNALSEIQKRGLESSHQKFVKFLDRYDIKIIDHAGEKYNEGLNVDVLSFEKDQSVKTPWIKETVEPSISCKGHIVKKGKVIVVNN